MSRYREDLVGLTFGRLFVLDAARINNHRETIWKCLCSCGNYTETPTSYKLKSGKTKSCGCLRKELLAARNKKSKR